MKTITKQEQNVLIKTLLPSYHCHIMTHPDSLIARTLGFFTLKFQGTHLRLLLMQNIFPRGINKLTFDLKGSKLDRKISKNKNLHSINDLIGDKVYKDLDFLSTQKYLSIPYKEALSVQKRIYEDIQLFSKLNIMDYSLLLGIADDRIYNWKYFIASGPEEVESGYVVGIIDYLQLYNGAKKLETFSKNLKVGVHRHDISSMNSEDYCKRFLKFITSIINAVPETEE